MSVKKKTRKARIILAAIFAAILCYALIKITTQTPDYTAERDSVEKAEEVARGEKEDDPARVELEDIPAPADPDLEYLTSLDIEKLQVENPDVIGWILIPGTNISYPLLKGEDNEYYLKHTWDNQKNAALPATGTPSFTDTTCEMVPCSPACTNIKRRISPIKTAAF